MLFMVDFVLELQENTESVSGVKHLGGAKNNNTYSYLVSGVDGHDFGVLMMRLPLKSYTVISHYHSTLLELHSCIHASDFCPSSFASRCHIVLWA